MAIKVTLNKIEMKSHPKIKDVKIGFILTKEICKEISITVLEIPPEIEIPIHVHEKEIDTIFVLEGEGEVFINGKWEKIGSGDVVVIFPKEQHGLKCKGETVMKCFIVHSPALW